MRTCVVLPSTSFDGKDLSPHNTPCLGIYASHLATLRKGTTGQTGGLGPHHRNPESNTQPPKVNKRNVKASAKPLKSPKVNNKHVKASPKPPRVNKRHVKASLKPLKPAKLTRRMSEQTLSLARLHGPP